ncbi:unnamed protein product, partial [Lampetra fluviatilis]
EAHRGPQRGPWGPRWDPGDDLRGRCEEKHPRVSSLLGLNCERPSRPTSLAPREARPARLPQFSLNAAPSAGRVALATPRVPLPPPCLPLPPVCPPRRPPVSPPPPPPRGVSVRVSLYHTPSLRGLLRLLLPEKLNEAVGLQHMKLYVTDDTVIVSG